MSSLTGTYDISVISAFKLAQKSIQQYSDVYEMTCHNTRISASLQFETSNLTNLMMGVRQRNTCPNADYFCCGQSVSTQLTQFTLKNHTAGNIKDDTATLILHALKNIGPIML